MTLSNLQTSDMAQFQTIIDLSIAEVTLMLKDTADQSQHANKLEALCGIIAFYKYTLLQVCNQPDQIRALDITVVNSSKDNLNFAKQLKEDAMLSVRDLLVDNHFYFGSVI